MYCVKCHKTYEPDKPKEVTIKGRGGTKMRAMTAHCPKCDTKGFQIMGKA